MYFTGKNYFCEFTCVKLKIATHQGGIVWHVVQYAKIYPRYNLAYIIKCLVHRQRLSVGV